MPHCTLTLALLFFLVQMFEHPLILWRRLCLASTGGLAVVLPAQRTATAYIAHQPQLSTIFSLCRVTFAFVVDMCLYSVFQAYLMGRQGAPSALRYVPFLGLAAWLVGGMQGESKSEEEAAAP